MMFNSVLKRFKKSIPTDKYYRSLMKNMLLIGVVVPLMPMFLVSGIILYQFQGSYKNKVQTHLKEVVQLGTENIDHFLKERLAVINMLADIFGFEQLREEAFLQEILRNLKAQHGSFYSDLEVIDGEGLQVAHAGPIKPGSAQHLGTDWYREVMKRGHVISDATSGSEDIPHFIMAVRKPRMGKQWVLRTAIHRDELNRFVEDVGIGETGSAFIMNRQGQNQAGPIHNINPGKKKLMEFLGIKEDANSDLFMVQRTNGSGHKTIYVTTLLKEGDWLLVYHQRVSEAFSGLRKIKIVALVVIVIVSLLIGTNALNRSKKTNKDKQKRNEQMFQTGKLASVGELAAGIAHEINNPVAIMVEEAGWIDDLLKEEEFQESENLSEYRRALRQIRTQGERCKEITHKLLSFARKTDSRVQEVHLNELIEDIITISAKRARLGGIIITTDIQKELPPIQVSPTELQQVLLNLINNALDAMEDKGGAVSISARLEEDTIVIEVSDDGPGIPEENLSQIFDPFFTTKPVGKGTGLGLSICYGIIEKLGGEISVRSAIDKGSTFRVEIPFKTGGGNRIENPSKIPDSHQ
jgi:two-component system NtrC family sensor kinase